jgi:predicted HTH transcriptional regulator
MRDFLRQIIEERELRRDKGDEEERIPEDKKTSDYKVRIALYDSFASTPQIIDLKEIEIRNFMDLLSQRTYEYSHERGGKIPYVVIKEIVENLIHANFKEVVVSIYKNGNIIRISDQGPGIGDKDKAILPGYTTAKEEMKKYIRGVGSGLPVAKESIELSGGTMNITDNLSSGTVVTLSLPTYKYKEKAQTRSEFKPSKQLGLSKRQSKVLFLITEMGKAGPTKVASELKISLSTAYRELVFLEEIGFIKSDKRGKRSLTKRGLESLENFFSSFKV